MNIMQTKPLRSFGMDITEKSLQPVLDEIGLKNSDGTARTVRDLSQAEKQIVRYLSVLKQSAEAHGDWANTIESPSNQLKIFNNQLVEAQRAFANLFIGTFGQILPYANAILMVIKEVSNAIATMFGIEISDYNTGIADMGDAFVDVSDSVDNATGSVKKLKRETLGFDQINNINEDTSGGSGSGNLSGGIDQKLLDAIKGYDNGMESVRMKALDIRDRIMEWLGFTKEIDPLTDKVSFKFADTNSTLCKIIKTLGEIFINGKKVITEVFMKMANDFKYGLFGEVILIELQSLNNILKFIGKNKAAQTLLARILETLINFKVLKTIVPGFKQLSDSINKNVKETKGWLSPLKDLYKSLDNVNFAGKSFFDGLKEGFSNWSKNLTQLDKFKLGIDGIATGIVSLSGISMTMEDISENGLNLANSLGLVTSELGTIASGAEIGSIFGPWGTIIGGATGAVVGLVEALTGYKSESDLALENAIKEREESEKYLQQLKEKEEQINKNRDANLRLVDSHQSLVSELKTLVDENGKVKTGYENRVNFILGELNKAYGTEYKLVDGQIEKYGELIGSVDLLIAKKKAQIMLEAAEQKYADAIKNKKEKLEEYIAAEKKYKELEEELSPILNQIESDKEKLSQQQERYNELKKNFNKLTNEENQEMYNLSASNRTLINEINSLETVHKKEIETLEEKKNTYEGLKETISKYASDEIEYNELVKISNMETAEEINKSLDSINTATGDSYSQRLELAYKYYETQLEQVKEKNGKLTEEDKTYWRGSIDNIINGMTEQSKTIEGLTPEVVQGWIKLATLSEEGFMQAFRQLEPNIRTEVISKMRASGYSISSELQSGIDQLVPTVKVDADISRINEKIQKAVSTFTKFTFNLGNIFKADGGVYSNGKWSPITQYANGGLPSIGQMFIAREKGPELVGKIGSHTAVMNNNQIVESVKAGVYEAVAMAMGSVGSTSVDINVHAEEGIIVEKAVRGIQQHVNQTGELPFTVPV